MNTLTKESGGPFFMSGTMDAIRPEENKMGTMTVNKLLLTMSLPMVISMLIQALHNVVDSIFVAQISETALTAVSLAFPIQNLIIAIAVGTGVGVNALLSRSLGEKNPEKANLAAVNGIFVFILSYLVSALFGIFFSQFYFTVQTGNEEIINQGTIYLSICTIFSFGVYLQIAFERIMQSTGRTIYNMITQGREPSSISFWTQSSYSGSLDFHALALPEPLLQLLSARSLP